MFVILSGEVTISQHEGFAPHRNIITQKAAQFTGELTRLSRHPSLVDAVAVGAAEVLVIAPDRLRDRMVAEADLGERIMRALILRRVDLLESGGGGSVIIGRADTATSCAWPDSCRATDNRTSAWIRMSMPTHVP